MVFDKVPFFLFEDTLLGESFCFKDSSEEICVYELRDVKPALERVDLLRRQGHYVVGYVAYEAGYCFYPVEENFLKKTDIPLLHFFSFSQKHEGLPEKSISSAVLPSGTLIDFTWDTSFEDYTLMQKKIRENLYNGEIYQQNQTIQLSFSCKQSAWDVYSRLREEQKTHYTCFLDFGDYQILSFSPELFYRKTGETVVVEPMKGTLPIAQKPEVLQADEKNISENLMIVDLLRNDLGKIARPGSVVVQDLFKVQTLKTVHQMTSKIAAKVDSETSVCTLFESLFPCGSITGAPKWSAMKLIAQQEHSRRGVYTGAIGFVEPDNNHCFSVAIRTLTVAQNRYSMGVGGGIVVDSEVLPEYQEALLKSRFVRKLNDSFYLFETLLFDGNTYRDLSRHLARLKRSALDFGFEFYSHQIEEALLKKTREFQGQQRIKIKLLYDGTFEIENSPVTVPVNSYLELPKTIAASSNRENYKITLSTKKIDANDIFRKHKTSKREIYDSEYLNAKNNGLYDIIFLNENDEVAEASRHNIFCKVDGEWVTPPLMTGALPGVARQKLIETMKAHSVPCKEGLLKLDDIKKAEQIVLTNSVRGVVPVTWSHS